MKMFAPVLAVAILAVSAQQAVANDRYEYPYVGVSFGQAELKDFCDDAVGSCDDDNTFYRIFSGARLLQNFGTEVGYTHHARFGGRDDDRIRPQALDITANVFMPVGDIMDVYAKAGAYIWRTKITDANGSSTNEDGVNFKTGVGARIGLGQMVSLRADFDWIPDFGNSALGGSTDLYMVSGGLQFTF